MGRKEEVGIAEQIRSRFQGGRKEKEKVKVNPFSLGLVTETDFNRLRRQAFFASQSLIEEESDPYQSPSPPKTSLSFLNTTTRKQLKTLIQKGIFKISTSPKK
ncbi:hypothetical protein CH380_03695 [Leptospira adleri]|uniref:Uncharacterized protein n=1 Tax=Leptospira adleri TaxID=2023186 RepID=A0A2M9YTG2_9LEPT|nr:hypothetical protein CH380_03695 [Leptospira adleri]PJZ61997.1 hypothetical protein CH376_10650 [Leptospira adleri]